MIPVLLSLILRLHSKALEQTSDRPYFGGLGGQHSESLLHAHLSPATPRTTRLSLVRVPVLSKQHTSTLPAKGMRKGSVQYMSERWSQGQGSCQAQPLGSPALLQVLTELGQGDEGGVDSQRQLNGQLRGHY